MTGLSRQFLTEIGVDMDDATLQAFNEHFDDTLHHRIIDRVIHTVDKQQLYQLTELRQAESDQAWQWLQANVPNLGDIVHEEVDATLADIVRNSDHL